MALEQVIYNLEEVKGSLMKSFTNAFMIVGAWKIIKLMSGGELSINEAGNWAGIRNAKTLSGNQSIEYPLADCMNCNQVCF